MKLDASCGKAMATGTTRIVMVLIIVFFIANLCEARRGGWRTGYRYRVRSSYRYRGSSSSSSSAGGNAGMIVGIIFGVIAGIFIMVFIYFLCRAYAFKNSSNRTVAYNSSHGVNFTNPITTTIATISHQPLDATVTPSVTYDTNYKASDAHGDTHNGFLPPSYDSAVRQGGDDTAQQYSSGHKEGLPESSYPANAPAMSYSPNPPEMSNHPNPPGMSYPPNPPEMSYPPNPSGFSYPPNPAAGYGFSAEGTYGLPYNSAAPSAPGHE